MSTRWWKAAAIVGWLLLFVSYVLRVGENGFVLPAVAAVVCLIVLVAMAVLADEPPPRRKALSHARTHPDRVHHARTSRRTR